MIVNLAKTRAGTQKTQTKNEERIKKESYLDFQWNGTTLSEFAVKTNDFMIKGMLFR